MFEATGQYYFYGDGWWNYGNAYNRGLVGLGARTMMLGSYYYHYGNGPYIFCVMPDE